VFSYSKSSIVNNCGNYGINPEKCNQGMWYFGARIAGSNFKLYKSLNDLGYANRLYQEHVKVLKDVATVAIDIPISFDAFPDA
jgi:hypothetical protein